MKVIKWIVRTLIVIGVLAIIANAVMGYFGWFKPHLPYVEQAPYKLTADGEVYYMKSYTQDKTSLTISDYYAWNKDDWQYYERSTPFGKQGYLKLTVERR